MHGDPFFTALSTLGVRHLVARIGSPSVAVTRRSLARGAIGPRAAARAPDGFFDVVHDGMRQPGFRTAMLSHMSLAMHLGRPRPTNFLSEPELRQLKAPVLMIWGDEDPYGGPEIGRRAAALIPDARLEVIAGRHAPFLDDPGPCGSARTRPAKRPDDKHWERIAGLAPAPQRRRPDGEDHAKPLVLRDEDEGRRGPEPLADCRLGRGVGPRGILGVVPWARRRRHRVGHPDRRGHRSDAKDKPHLATIGRRGDSWFVDEKASPA